MQNDALVEAWLEYCRPRLPLQNPLWAFIHNNILLSFEHLPFLDAVREASALYRARPFESERFYREALASGRIRRETLEAVLAERFPELGPERVERFLGDPALGDTLPPLQSLRLAPRLDAHFPVRHQRQLVDLLVPLIASYLDQGIAGWPSPMHRESLWDAFVETVDDMPSWGLEFAPALRARVHAHLDAGRDVEAVVAREVERNAPPGREAEYCLETLFALKGWSGMVWRLEAEPAIAPLESPPKLRLIDWLAVLLVSQHAIDEWILVTQRCERAELLRRPAPIEESRGLARAHLWQLAYERSFGGELLAHLERGLPDGHAPAQRARPSVQALVCMDDREESFRRALEAPGCDVETWGAVGFFGLDMRFEALGTARPTRQCPPVVEPSRTLRELPLDGEDDALTRMQKVGRAGATARLAAYYHSRTLLRGFAISLGLGLLGFVPLVLKVLLPSRISRWRRGVVNAAFPHPRTRIALEAPGGYTLAEQAGIVDGVLRTCGLTSDLAPLVAVVAHGASSANNPFRQAYGCGACCGNSGAPNARTFAAMANRREVRALLAQRGLVVPTDTLFVPCLHDTTLDTAEVLDRALLPPGRAGELEDLEQRLERACRSNALERAARFEQGPAWEDAERARPDAEERAAQHAQDRGHDLAQPRPEYGHNRVAACIVGRRDLTRGVFLDRRSFLVSYDPSQDSDGQTLAAAVLGSVPVAVNIAMDYYFSRVDSDGFGAGSKLPLNVVSLLGVISGSKSDLRIGLARQMVELHEPMRALVLLEASEAHVHALIASNARLTRLVRNGWMQLGRIDPESRAIELFDGSTFRPWRSYWSEFDRFGATAADAKPAGLDWRRDQRVEVTA